jgi:DNA-binding transcriptional LysR family regulator
VDLDHLRVLVAVLESGTFTRAAARLKLSQPAVSQHMAALEREAGIALFERSGRLRVPTDAAHELAQRGRAAMAALDDADRTAEQLRGLRGGRLAVGATESVGTYRVPAMLGAFAKQHPDVELRMDIADAADLLQRLRSRDLDVGIICEMGPAEGVETSSLADERLVPVWGPESPMASGKATLERFLEQPFIARERGSGIGRAVDRWLLEQENGPRPAMELGSLEAMKQAVLSGLGVSILPEPGVKADVDRGALRVGRFQGMPLKARVDVAVLEGRRAPKPLEAFLRGVLGSRAKALVGDAG